MSNPTLLIVLALLGTSRAIFAADAPRLPAVDEAMRDSISKNQMAGVVTLVADRKQVLHLSALGKADVAASRDMKTDDVMWIASMTKPITAVAALMLMEEGKLSLDDQVSKYLPEYAALKKANGDPANITIRQCLTHTSGLADSTRAEDKAAATLADLVPSLVNKKLEFDPGARWKYCQNGINTVARIVEVVSRQSFPDFLDVRIFKPLGMKDTTFYPTAEQLPRLAKSYRLTNNALVETPIEFLQNRSPSDHSRLPAGNGGLFSTAPDYLQFSQMLLNEGALNGKTYLKPETVKLMRTIQTGDLKTGFTDGNGWGIGVCVVREPQKVSAMLSPGTFGHGGAYCTQAWIDPVKDRIYLLMRQRAGHPNSDDSEMRLAFQTAAAK